MTSNNINSFVLECFGDTPCEQILSELEFLHSRLTIIDPPELYKLSPTNQWQYLRPFIEEEADQKSLNFVEKLASHNHIKFLIDPRVYGEGIETLKEYFYTNKEVIFVSPVELKVSFKNEILKQLEQKFKNKLRVVYLVDPDLIAGFVVIFGEETYDFSLKSCAGQLIFNKVRAYASEKS